MLEEWKAAEGQDTVDEEARSRFTKDTVAFKGH